MKTYASRLTLHFHLVFFYSNESFTAHFAGIGFFGRWRRDEGRCFANVSRILLVEYIYRLQSYIALIA